MSVEVNWWAVILATVSSMIVGSIWYAKSVFGESWAKLAGVKLNDERMKRNAPKSIGVTIVVSFLTAYILAHVTFLSHNFFHNSYFQDAITTAFWLWLGLTAARIVTHDVFEGRPAKLTLLTISHELVTLLVMGAVIGWLGVG